MFISKRNGDEKGKLQNHWETLGIFNIRDIKKVSIIKGALAGVKNQFTKLSIYCIVAANCMI